MLNDGDRRPGFERLADEVARGPDLVDVIEEPHPLVAERGQLPEPVADRVAIAEILPSATVGEPAHVVGVEVHEVEGVRVGLDEGARVGRVALPESRRHVVQRDRDAGGFERADAGARGFSHPALGVEIARDVDAERRRSDEVRDGAGARASAGRRPVRRVIAARRPPRLHTPERFNRAPGVARANRGDARLRGRRVLLHLLVAGGEAAQIVEGGFRFRADRGQLAREPPRVLAGPREGLFGRRRDRERARWFCPSREP